MKLAVLGLWHLGLVTTGCLADKYQNVIGYDADADLIANLNQEILPIQEPGLSELIKTAKAKNNLQFTADKNQLAIADVIWVTYDTPVDENDIADTQYVMNQIIAVMPILKEEATIIISSQLPIGSTKQLQRQQQQLFPNKKFNYVCIPENLRLGKAIEVFTKPDRVIIGIDTDVIKPQLEKLFSPWTDKLIWMRIESAEMTKHAINAFLATSVVFANEIAVICEKYGADASEVEKGLKSEERIGPKAYLKPGSAFAGGTLARDIQYLIEFSKKAKVDSQLFPAVLHSNQQHKQWVQNRLLEIFDSLQDKTVTVLGLTYKTGTNTLRRSAAVELCDWLADKQAKIKVYDAQTIHLPAEMTTKIELKSKLADAVHNVDAVIIMNNDAAFISLADLANQNQTKPAIVIDPAGYLSNQFKTHHHVKYFQVGSSQ